MDREGTVNGRKVLIAGLTLFSMFFGAGNLIFPPFLAVQAGTALVLMSGKKMYSYCLQVTMYIGGVMRARSHID